jgi:hypothetical protein
MGGEPMDPDVVHCMPHLSSTCTQLQMNHALSDTLPGSVRFRACLKGTSAFTLSNNNSASLNYQSRALLRVEHKQMLSNSDRLDAVAYYCLLPPGARNAPGDIWLALRQTHFAANVHCVFSATIHECFNIVTFYSCSSRLWRFDCKRLG